jgi:hypothetical protein
MNAPVIDLAPTRMWDVLHDRLLRETAIPTIASDIIVVGSPRSWEKIMEWKWLELKLSEYTDRLA